ncbi:MAG: nitrogen regulation protein NR(I), partial [Gammaproteobacteria bacterium]
MNRRDVPLIWILDDDKAIGWVLEQTLNQADFRVRYFSHPGEFLQEIQKQTPDLVFSDIRMPDMDGIEVLTQLSANYPDLPVIIMTAFPGIDPAANAFQKGAFEYLAKPFDIDHVVELARKATRGTSKVQEKKKSSEGKHRFIGQSPVMQQIFATIGRLSTTHVNVLITGETGTGKELVAQALHQYSPRRHKPMVAINIAAIPKELIESELFGHEKGAFTGAVERKPGRFEQAHEGTLFLDEIGDMPMEVQTRLLRVLANGEFYRVGGTIPIRTNTRILAATHQNLADRVKEGSFREDLYHRLNVINLHCPPLRDRQEDIPDLAEFFFESQATPLHKSALRLRSDTLDILQHYHWPGNVRELENLCQKLSVMVTGEQVTPGDLPENIILAAQSLKEKKRSESSEQKFVKVTTEWIAELLKKKSNAIYQTLNRIVETTAIKESLDYHQGHKQKAA